MRGAAQPERDAESCARDDTCEKDKCTSPQKSSGMKETDAHMDQADKVAARFPVYAHASVGDDHDTAGIDQKGVIFADTGL